MSESRIDEFLRAWLSTGSGRIGQILVRRRADERYEVVHVADAERPVAELTPQEGAFAALELSKYNEAGAFRALKGAFDLRPGWVLRLEDLAEVREALDYFYPAALGLWKAFQAGRLRRFSLRETLRRQTGMYRFAHTISDAGARYIIENRCWSTCLRLRLWSIDAVNGQEAIPAGENNVLPFLCPEACNLLVSDARERAKSEAELARQETS